jgi:hypothetical protein
MCNASTSPTLRSQTLVRHVVELCGSGDFLDETGAALHQAGIQAAVASRDTPALVDWLLQAFSFQGVSDAIAQRYLDAHGQASWADVHSSLQAQPSCSKLQSFNTFRGCGYAKTALTCSEPTHLSSCSLPLMPLRNGRLNQIAYALVLFARDVCGGDLVGWIDQQLELADDPTTPGRVQRMRAALLEPLSRIGGISYKVLAMTLSDILLCGDPARERWVTTGASMIAIDTLVHNWMHRTGILHEHGAEHAYGPRCYAPGGCADLIEEAAQAVDARVLNPGFPAVFPRLVQVAIWLFCAERGFDFCNGNRIDDRAPCQRQTCVFWDECQHVPLHPAK